jgi:pimeloyl-ACP methyl ester carboxylesterase
MSTKVAGTLPTLTKYSETSTFAFKKPIPTTPELTSFTTEFLTRLADIENKTKTSTLKSGRTYCYFDEATADNLPIVLAFHGVGQSKELWMQPEPMPNVRLIAIDRLGYGGSSQQPVPFSFGEAVKDYEEFLNNLGIDKFYVVGHSAGAPFALQIATYLGDRVLGCASISATCDLYHRTAPTKGTMAWKNLVDSVMIANACSPNPGCCGGCIRNCILGNMLGGMMYTADKTKDCGFHSLYVDSERKGDGGCERTWLAMDKKPFFVQTNLYSVMHSCNSKQTALGDLWRVHMPWDYDVSTMQCPCVIYHGDPELIRLNNAHQNQKAMPNAKLQILKGHGHTTIMMEAPTIIQALVVGNVAEMVY